MIGLSRRLVVGLVSGLAATVFASSSSWAEPPEGARAGNIQKKAGVATEYGLPGEDSPSAFVPRHPRSVEDQKQIEAVRDFSAARALEDRRAWSDAIALLEKALTIEPDSVAILKRLSRLCFMLGKTEQALQYSRRVLESDPGDSDTISRLVSHFNRKGDASGLETILQGVLENPKLGAHAPGRLLADYELGKLYANRLQQPEKAANAFAHVVEALDEKAANRLSPLDHARILGEDPAEAYLEFGKVFVEAKRYDLAIRAFQRGLVYNEEHPQLPLSLADAFLKTGKDREALDLVERFLKRQPQGSDGYELLEKVLTALHREDEITPRLEQATKRDSKNLPLQYALADRYHKIGQVDRAEAIYKALLAAQPTPDGYSALAASLLKRRKAEELLKLFTEGLTKPWGFEALKKQIDAVIKDPGLADDMLDAGLKLLSADPPRLDKTAVNILAAVAKDSGKYDKLVPILRVMLKQNPSPQVYREIAHTVGESLHKFDEAAATVEEMLAKYPDERNGRTLTQLGEFRRRAGKYDAAVEALREAVKLEPNNGEAQFVLGWSLSLSGKPEEGFEILRGALKNDPKNAAFNRLYGSLLMQFGKNDEAIALYKGLLDRYPNDDEILELVHSGLSVAFVNKGDYVKGEAELEVLYQRDPENPGVNNDLGYLYAEQGKNLEQAESMIRKALQQEPNNGAYLDSLGWVLFKRGKAKEAIEPMEKAIKGLSGTGGDATIYEHLGDVYFQLQEHAKAKAAWGHAEASAAKAIPTDKRLPEIRKKLESLGKLAPAPKPTAGDTP